jgi:hypothetical protein
LGRAREALAIAVNESPACSPTRISSRSSSESRNGDRGRVLALTPPSLTTNLRTERPVHPTAAPASPAETPDAINSITNNLSSRVIRANFERPSDTSDRATTT